MANCSGSTLLTTLREREYAYLISEAFPAALMARGLTLA